MDHGRYRWYLRREQAADEARELLDGPVEVVVLDDVVEAARLPAAAPGEVDPLADLARALGRPLAQPALELVARGR